LGCSARRTGGLVGIWVLCVSRGEEKSVRFVGLGRGKEASRGAAGDGEKKGLVWRGRRPSASGRPSEAGAPSPIVLHSLSLLKTQPP
jgi:hypothetical protein